MQHGHSEKLRRSVIPMRLKQIVVMLAIVALAMPLAAQMGMQVPTLSGIFRPVVGTGAVYQVTQEGGKTSTMDFAVLGKEDMGGKTGYWIEMSMTDPKAGGEITM